MSFEANGFTPVGEKNKSSKPCRKCGFKELTYQVHESSCGGYEDYKYTCSHCGYVFWIDGCDS